MSQEIEIEFKNLVNQTDFLKLLTHFSVSERNFKTQTNYYFDTSDFQLRTHSSALRIREKAGQFTFTLKQPNQIGLLETHQLLSENEAQIALNGGHLPKGIIATQLFNSFQIDVNTCHFLGALTTNRAEIPYREGLLVFDHSFYFDVNDYEIEYEVKDEKIGKEIFEKLFSDHHIPLQKTDNKIKRFFSKKT